MEQGRSVRPAVLAGRWYEGEPKKLRANVEGWMEGGPGADSPAPVAIIAPHAGHVWSGDIAGRAWSAVRGRPYKRVFILCPNHRAPVTGIVADGHDAFDSPLGAVAVDTKTRDALVASGTVHVDSSAHRLEHAIEIQLPFLRVAAPDAEVVPLIVGQLSDRMARKFAAQLRRLLTPGDLIVVSSDFIHYGDSYGYVPFTTDVRENLARADAHTVDAIGWLDGRRFAGFARENPHSACGINSLRVLAWTLQDTGATSQRLAYSTSADKTGDYGMSVSYVAMQIYNVDFDRLSGPVDDAGEEPSAPVTVLDEAGRARANALIRMAVEQAVRAGHETPFVPSEIVGRIGVFPKIFEQEFGVFVTLHKNGALRGCIGNILPYQNLMMALWGRAQDAALNDPRFDPVTLAELPQITYEISILTPPEPVSGPSDIIIGRHGVILKKSGRSAVFLPQVAPEQGWNVEQMLSALSLKAGLPADAWRDGAGFSTFEAQVF